MSFNNGEYLYNNLPSTYRVNDVDTNYTLKRYLGVLGLGFDKVEEDIKNLLTLNDPEKIDAKFLPYYANMFGVSHAFDVPEEFLRKYLANLVDIMKRKGTKEVIEFTSRELTGLNATVTEGHYSAFRTWSNNPHNEKCGEYEVPRTYSNKDKPIYYFVGGEKTDRLTVMVTLSNPTDKESHEIFLNTQMLSQLVKDLVQPYINLIFKAHGILDTDVCEKLEILEDDFTTRLNNTYIKNNRVTEILNKNKLKSKEAYVVPARTIEEDFIDIITLIDVPEDTITIGEIIEEDLGTNIDMFDTQGVTIEVEDENVINIREVPHIYTHKVNVNLTDMFKFHDTSNIPRPTIDFVDLGVTKNRTRDAEDVFIRKTYEVLEDNIQQN